MTDPLTTGLGGLDDSVKIVVNETTISKAISWNIHEGVLAQPATWSITFGSGDVAAPLLKQLPPGPTSLVRVYVGNVLQQSGYIDAVEASQPAGGATTITIRGRDAMAPLQDTYVSSSIAANVTTYAQLVWFALQQCGLVHGSTIDPDYLATDNSANRNLKAGVPIQAILPHRTVQQILDNEGAGLNAGVFTATVQAKLHETWHHFIRRHIDRAGLMFWAAGDGSFVLAAPNGNQSPTYLLRRKTGQPTDRTRANVIAMRFMDDRTHRHSEAIVYARGGGKALGRVKSKGGFPDDEMVASGYAHQPIVYRDANCKSGAEAEFFARRKIAEERRSGWHLEYTVSGSTLPFAGTGGVTRAVIVPDTIVAVDDDELDLYALAAASAANGGDPPSSQYYIEAVDRQRGPSGTTTTMRLMRVADLVFGADEDT
jgi:prophage tail gpP-like protein